MKVNDFLDFPVPEPKYKIPITKSAEEPSSQRKSTHRRSWASAPTAELAVQGEIERKQKEIERKKEDGPSSIELEGERIEEWIFGPEKKAVKEPAPGTKADDDAEKAAAEARRKAEEEERKRAQEGPVMRR